MSFTPARRPSTGRRVYFDPGNPLENDASSASFALMNPSTVPMIRSPLHQAESPSSNDFQPTSGEEMVRGTRRIEMPRERVLVRSPEPLASPQEHSRETRSSEESETGLEEEQSDYFSAVTAYKSAQAAMRSSEATSSSYTDKHVEPPPFNSGHNAPRWPSSRPNMRRNTPRYVSAPLAYEGSGMPAPIHPAHSRVASTAILTSSSLQEEDLSDIQTPLPLYHARGSDVQRSDRSCTAHVQQYDPAASPSTIEPLSRPAYRAPSDVLSLRSAMKPSHSSTMMDAVAPIAQHAMRIGQTAPRSALRPPEASNPGFHGTLSYYYYDRMTGGNTQPQDTPKAKEEVSEKMEAQREQSIASLLGRDEEPMEPDDPRVTGTRRQSVDLRREAQENRFFLADDQCSSVTGSSSDGFMKGKRHGRGIHNFIDPIKNSAILNGGLGGGHKMRKYHSSVLAHIDERRRLVLKMAKALMFFGAPSHRVESQLNALSRVLDVDAQFIHFPGIVIANFGDFEHNNSQCHFVKSKTEIALGRLTELHVVYKSILADNITVLEAAETLRNLLQAPPEWSNLSRILFSIVKCGMMAPINFGGSFVDVWISALFGGLLTFSQLCLAGNNQMFSNTFDIAVAIMFSFFSRLLSAKSVFCYEAIASSGLIGLLPGYAILCASLELASKNMMAGSVRMVYAIIYSLFLGFAIAIGSELYYFVDPASRSVAMSPVALQTTKLVGQFILANQTTPNWTGTFLFTNSTTKARAAGSIVCARRPEWPWWRQSVPPVSKAATVPIFSLLSCLSFLHPLKSREVPVSVVIACVGFGANVLANKYIFDRSDVVSAIGSFVIGVLGNAYSRIWNATAFTAITVAVNFLVPSGMAMAGGLAMTYKGSDGDLYTNGLTLGFRMVQVSIGITTGLFVSALLVHMVGNKRSNAVLFAF